MIRVGSPEDHGLALAAIQIDGGTQSRANVNDQVDNEYAEAIKAGATFPPIVVFYDGKKHWLADGFHRFHAYQKIGREKVAADIRQGTRRDAILHSVGANETHGLRRTRDDKRRAVLTLLNDAEWSAKPERWIATTANVSHTYVQKIRAEHLATLPDRPSEVEVERGGKTYAMQTANIGAKPVSKENLEAEVITPKPSDPKASSAETGELVTTLPSVPSVVLQMAWDRASIQERADFLARNNLTEQPKVGTHDAEACNPHRNAVDLASITADGRANMEPDDVDRSAERASSAVEVGAPVSPEEAHNIGNPIQAGNDTALAAREADESAALNPQSAAAPAEAVAILQASQAATATPFATLSKADQIRLIRPHCQHADDLAKCGGSGRNHCPACTKALAEGEAA